MEGIKPVSSLIATLPTAAKMHRTIDEFYEEAHSDPSAVNSTGDVARLLGKRLPYFMLFVALGLANVGDASEIGSMGFLLAHEGFREDVVRGKEGIVASALYIGMLVGGIVAGPLCDVMGQRSVLLYGLLLNASFGIATAMSMETWQIIACRVLMGLGIGGVVSCLLALTSEHTPLRVRGSYLNFVSAFWTIGSIYVAILAFLLFGVFDKNWRLFVLINAAPSLLSFALVTCFVPESARFLALRGQHQRASQAANIVAQSMGHGGEPLREDEVRAHYSEPPPKQGAMESVRKIYGASRRRHILVTQALWFFMSFGSGTCLWIARIFYELPYVNDVYTMTLVFALASLPGVFVAGAVLDKTKRTAVLLSSVLGTTFSMAGFALLSSLTSEAWAVVLAACVFHSALVISWSALSVVTAEAFPASIRSTAMGLCAASGRFASVIVHLISAPLVDNTAPTGLLIMGSSAFAISTVLSAVTHFKQRTHFQDRVRVQHATTTTKTNNGDLEMQTIHSRSSKRGAEVCRV